MRLQKFNFLRSSPRRAGSPPSSSGFVSALPKPPRSRRVASIGIAAALVAPLLVAAPVSGDGSATNARPEENAGDEQEPDAEPPETPIPESWLPRVRRCHRTAQRRWCDGPRRVPEPHGPAAELAERIGIGDRRTASRLLIDGPRAEWMEAVRGHVRETLQWPVDGGRIGRSLGRRTRDRYDRRHNGLDIPAPFGTPVMAVNDGLVVYSDNGVSGMGNLVIVLHADATATFYVHLKRAFLFPGQSVQRGQVLGEVGSTGISQGPHLHFEWRRNGIPQDALPALVGFPLNEAGLPDFARQRPRWHAARLRGFEHRAVDRPRRR